MTSPHYLVVATSGRAIAQGLSSLGCSVAVIDGFADCDTQTIATEVKKTKRSQFGLDHDGVLLAVQRLRSNASFDGILYDAAIESNPKLLDLIDIEPVLGNSIQVIEATKNTEIFFSILDQHSIPYPETAFSLSSKLYIGNAWLLKYAQGTGGIGVTPLTKNTEIAENAYFQEKLEGVSFSITFLANSNEIFALGFNTLWTVPLGMTVPYAYAGAINEVKLDESILEVALKYAKVLVKEFKLIGLNSIDFIYANDSVYVLEINPRIPATYELYESKNGDVIRQHIQACVDKTLPKSRNKTLLRAHAIVYAQSELVIPDTMAWPLWAADRPHAQEVIKKFEPVCSIFAGGRNYAQVNEMIKTRKRSILATLLTK
jgi:predicted ATP-grasp superfamily ATP-dependent carboligase